MAATATLVVKTVSRQEFRVQTDETSSVLTVKKALQTMASAENPSPVERQKLIYQGKVLDDGQLIKDMSIAEGTFFVLMLSSVPPTASASAPPVPAPAPAPAAAPPAATLPPVPPPPSAAAAVVPGQQPLQALRSHPQFPDLRRMLRQQPEMLPQVLDMLAATNPEIVAEIAAHEVEFFHLLAEPDDFAGEDDDDAEDGDYVGGDDEGGDFDEEDQEDLDFLRLLATCPPQHQQQLATTLGIAPERFQQLMAMIHSLSDEGLQDLLAGGGDGDGDGYEMDQGEGDEMMGAMENFTQAEQESIQRLASMGFDVQTCLQAFLACDRDEALAANLLLDGGYDD